MHSAARRRAATASAWAARVLGLTHALCSAYWPVGGTQLLRTLGRPFDTWTRPYELPVLFEFWMLTLLTAAVAITTRALQYDNVPPPRLGLTGSTAAGVLTLDGAWTSDAWYVLWGVVFALSLQGSSKDRPGAVVAPGRS